MSVDLRHPPPPGISISVVVPFHNSEAFIRDCIEALLAQRYPHDQFEIIMVDNNSTDGCTSIVSRYRDVQLLSEPKHGSYAARNRGVSAARGDVIAFTDSDCAPGPDWLAAIDDAMSDPQVHLIQGRQRFASESLCLSMLADYECAKAAYTFSAHRPELYYGYTNNMAVRRTLFDTVGAFDEVMRGADSLFVHRTIRTLSCDAIRFAPQMWVRHLEIQTAWEWFKKLHIYGQSFRRHQRLVQRTPLQAKDRLEVFRSTVRSNHYSKAKSSLLFVVLTGGMMAYELGRRRPTGV